jgi:hypothetical protein
MLECSYWHSGLFFIHDRCDHPPHRALVVSDRSARCQAIRRNDDALVHAGAMRVNRDLRRALGVARIIYGLANDKPPAFEARVLPRRRYVPLYTG